MRRRNFPQGASVTSLRIHYSTEPKDALAYSLCPIYAYLWHHHQVLGTLAQRQLQCSRSNGYHWMSLKCIV